MSFEDDSLGLDFGDNRWSRLMGGYRIPFDPRNLLRSIKLAESDAKACEAHAELFGELYHQGDVGEASYAAVPHLVDIHERRGAADWNTYASVALIEDARRSGENPDVPDFLASAYEDAWRRLAQIGLRELSAADEPLLASSILAVLAMHKKQYVLGKFAVLFDEGERKALLGTRY